MAVELNVSFRDTDTLVAEVDALRTELVESVSQNASLEAELETTNSYCEHLKDQLSRRAEGTVASLQQRYNEMEKAHEDICRENQNLHLKVAELSTTKNAELQRLQETHCEHNSLLECQIEELQKQAANREEHIKHLQQQLDLSSDESSHRSKKVLTLEHRIEELQRQAADFQQQESKSSYGRANHNRLGSNSTFSDVQSHLSHLQEQLIYSTALNNIILDSHKESNPYYIERARDISASVQQEFQCLNETVNSLSSERETLERQVCKHYLVPFSCKYRRQCMMMWSTITCHIVDIKNQHRYHNYRIS